MSEKDIEILSSEDPEVRLPVRESELFEFISSLIGKNEIIRKKSSVNLTLIDNQY